MTKKNVENFFFKIFFYFVLESYETYAKKNYHRLFLREGGLQIVNLEKPHLR